MEEESEQAQNKSTPTVADKVKNTLSNSKILGNLSKASFIELFYDLVFIVSMRSIFPLLCEAEEAGAAYTYCSFAFAFMLMMQVWFSSTVLMNRCATGDIRDYKFLLVNMFLMYVMSRSIDITWGHRIAFCVSWILINVNTTYHWWRRFKLLGTNPDKATVKFVNRTVAVLLIQAAMVLVSCFLPGPSTGLLWFAALVVGFVGWTIRAPLTENGREHLVERCSLLLILTFGETIIGIDSVVQETMAQGYSTTVGVIVAAVYFIMVVAMFAVYIIELQLKLDSGKIKTGSEFILVSAVITFCLANVNASFDLVAEDKMIGFFNSSDLLAVSITAFLLSFFMFTPFNKKPVKNSPGRIVLRVVFCLMVLADFAALPIASLAENSEDFGVLLGVFIGGVFTLVLNTIAPALVARLDYRSMKPKVKKNKERHEISPQ